MAEARKKRRRQRTDSGRFQYFANSESGSGGGGNDDGGGRNLYSRCSRGKEGGRQRTNGRTDGEERGELRGTLEISRPPPPSVHLSRRRRSGPANKCNIHPPHAPPSLPAVPKSGLIQVRGTRRSTGEGGADTWDPSKVGHHRLRPPRRRRRQHINHGKDGCNTRH